MIKTTGVCAGFLYQIGQGSLYFVDENGESSPFSNPTFKEAFEKANHIAFANFSRKGELSFSPQEQEIIVEVAHKAAEETKKHLSDEQISTYNELLLEKSTSTPLFENVATWKLGTDRKRFVVLMAAYLHDAITSLKEKKHVQTCKLVESGETAGKKVLQFVKPEELIELSMEQVFLLLKSAPSYALLHAMVYTPEFFVPGYEKLHRAQGATWSIGDFSSYEKLSAFSEENLDLLIAVMDDMVGNREKQWDKIEAEATETLVKFAEAQIKHCKGVAARIASLLEEHPNTLIIESAKHRRFLLGALAEREIHVKEVNSSSQ